MAIEILGQHDSGLPIFSPSSPLLMYAAEFEYAAKSGQTDFIRRISFTDPQRRRPDEFIAQSENDLIKLGQLCGTTILKHTFGLYPIQDHKPRPNPRSPLEILEAREFVPDYMLSAIVPVIDRLGSKLMRPPKHIRKGIRRYKAEKGTIQDVLWRQFMYGSIGGGHPEWYMHDLDLRTRDPIPKQRIRDYL